MKKKGAKKERKGLSKFPIQSLILRRALPALSTVGRNPKKHLARRIFPIWTIRYVPTSPKTKKKRKMGS